MRGGTAVDGRGQKFHLFLVKKEGSKIFFWGEFLSLACVSRNRWVVSFDFFFFFYLVSV